METWSHLEKGLPKNSEFKKFASGYPGDQKTINWLKNSFSPIFGFPQFVRFDWSTAKKLIDDDGQCGLEFYDEEEEIKRLSKKRKRDEVSGVQKKERSDFFKFQNLERCSFDGEDREQQGLFCF